MFKTKLHFWTLELLLLSLLFYVGTKISFLFEPIVIFTSTLFFPILISGFLYFLFNPTVDFLVKRRMPRGLAILLLYVLFLGLISLLVGLVGPSLSKQVTDLINNLPDYFNQTRKFIEDSADSKWFLWTVEQDYVPLQEVGDSLQKYLTNLPSNITNSLTSVFSVVTNITLVVVTVPFILFYMLKDGDKLPAAIMKFVPVRYRKPALTVLQETGGTLTTYIQGQMLVCMFVGIGTFIGYLIIGLPYAFLFALIGAVTNIIPYVGPFIGAAPAVIVALIHSPTEALLVILVVTVIQQLDGNFISPLVIGKKLNTHPLTIIILLLVAGNIAGIIGMILAVPTYSVVKTIVLNIVKFIRIRKEEKLEEDILE
ncbi:AI-2E family transporter [Peribacillus frigoritolerans]|uniref:AI-2E family transporter n=1 Tax=Peribacillus frigoritolerans TaxID=450367 RepID=UPI0021617064|nr:AI-2E family transporter [Peribacillus frigoritolerans]